MGNAPVPENYVPILIFIGVGIALGTLTLLIGWFVRPNQPYRAKLAPYESGSPLFQDARVQFPMRYYIIAMLFVIFDIEIVFMFPWAVALQSWAGWISGDGPVHRYSGGGVLVCMEKRGAGVGLKGDGLSFVLAHRARKIDYYIWTEGGARWMRAVKGSPSPFRKRSGEEHEFARTAV